MLEGLFTFIGIAVIALVAIAVLYVVSRISQENSETIQRNFTLIANNYNIQIDDNPKLLFGADGVGYPGIRGVINDKKFVLRTYSEGDKHSSTTYTEARIECYLEGYFRIEEGYVTGMGKLFGAEDAKIGNEEIDDFYRIKIEDKTLIPQIFDEQTITTLEYAKEIFKGCIRYDNDALVYFEEVNLDNEVCRKRFEKMITVLLVLSDKLEAAQA